MGRCRSYLHPVCVCGCDIAGDVGIMDRHFDLFGVICGAVTERVGAVPIFTPFLHVIRLGRFLGDQFRLFSCLCTVSDWDEVGIQRGDV